MALPAATPNSSDASRLDPKKPKSQTERHRGECILLRNSIETARKISANSSSVNGT